MPLYELFCISRVGLSKSSFADHIKKTSMKIFDNDGVIRSIQYIGLEPLPYRIRNQAEYQYYGRYWLIYFYASPTLMKPLDDFMKNTPEIIRHTILKRTDKLKDILKPL